METKQKFLQLQFLYAACSVYVIARFGVLSGVIIGMPDFDIPVFCCQIIGIVGGGLALYSFYKTLGKELPVPFLGLAGGGLFYCFTDFDS